MGVSSASTETMLAGRQLPKSGQCLRPCYTGLILMEFSRMPVVELDRISKAYDKKIAVQDLSLRIEPGSMFGLLGPNGAGKTSSIRMMIGVTLPDSGTVT